MKMLPQSFNNPKNLRISFPVDQFGNHIDEVMGCVEEDLFLFGLVELIEKMLGIVKKFVCQPFEQNFISQFWCQIFNGDQALSKNLLKKNLCLACPFLYQSIRHLFKQAIRFFLKGVSSLEFFEGMVFLEKGFGSPQERLFL